MTEAELKLMNSHQDYNMYASDMRIKPDVLTGYKGEQLAIFVLNNRDTMHDTFNADGHVRHMMSLTKTNVRPVPIALDRIVDYDL